MTKLWRTQSCRHTVCTADGTMIENYGTIVCKGLYNDFCVQGSLLENYNTIECPVLLSESSMCDPVLGVFSVFE